ncbi:hypothetical protein BMF94_4533 [Rhodotorula taiwanensis]|uniref:Uncharacterized protein n=1 Tax=Rhodotorula taiwanensis TaxID=741276 RepID=A0A2S5B7E7_9BASI|nr:hypothetical protein BMF94_4533 [Rhodotorula taiwanensis]
MVSKLNAPLEPGQAKHDSPSRSSSTTRSRTSMIFRPPVSAPPDPTK